MDIFSFSIGITSGCVLSYAVYQTIFGHKLNQVKILEETLLQHKSNEYNLQQELKEKQLELQDILTRNASIQAQLATLKEQHQTWVQSLQTQWNQQFESFMLRQVDTAKTNFKESAKTELSEKHAYFEEKMSEMLKPLMQTIESYKQDVALIDRQHLKSTEVIMNEVKRLGEINTKLSQSLSHNKGRGNWGEIELERLLEESGLIEGVGYVKQESFKGGKKRPDFRIILPDNRSIFIDSKAIQVDLNDSDEGLSEEDIKEKQKRYAKSLEEAIKNLSSKEYQVELDNAADFVVLYVPRESMLANAMTANPNLFELAYRHNIILAGPYNLMGLLKLVYHGWRTAQLSEQAHSIMKLGVDLQQQAVIFAERFEKVGKSLDNLSKNYQDALCAFDGKTGFTKKIKKLEEYGCHSGKQMPENLYQPEHSSILYGGNAESCRA